MMRNIKTHHFDLEMILLVYKYKCYNYHAIITFIIPILDIQHLMGFQILK